MELATLTVVRSTARATGRSVGEAIVGTTVGVAVAFGIISAAGSNVIAYAVLTPICIALAIYGRAVFDFLAGQAGFTVSVLVLFSLLRPAGWHIGIVRLEDVVIGTAAGLVASVVAWPRGSVATIGPAAADLLERSANYLVLSVHRITSEPGHEATSATAGDARQQTMAAVLLAESAYSQILAERPDPTSTTRWSSVMAVGNRLWYVADLLLTNAVASVPDREEAAAAANRLRDTADQVAATLRHERGAVTAPPRPAADPYEGAYGLSTWLDELTDQLHELGRGLPQH